MGDSLEEARAAFEALAWQRAHAAYSASVGSDLGPDDLDRFAQCACMLGWLPDYFTIRERQYDGYLAAGDHEGAARAATFIAIQRIVEGEVGAGTGWLARAERHAKQTGEGSLGRGYASMASAFGALIGGEPQRAIELSAEAAAIAKAHRDRELEALALHQQGMFLVRGGMVSLGLPLFDEVMLVLASGGLSPMVTGIVYCNVVSGCWEVNELTRAREWTAAMSRWCEAQPELANFNDECRVRRAELKILHGEWTAALAELDGISHTDIDPGSSALGAYLRGNVARWQGRDVDAEAAYRECARLGQEPQPGLALLRLTQGSTQAAAAMTRRALVEVQDLGRRVELLAGAVEVLLAVDAADAAAQALAELEARAALQSSPLTSAFADQAKARLALHQGDPEAALVPLRTALKACLQLRTPHHEATTRSLLAEACAALGDEESASRESSLAAETWSDLGAAAARSGDSPLTLREVEVLRLVATGATNKAIAEALVLSERTVDRHVSNILAKLGVPTRAAATAYAVERSLV